MFNSMSWSAKWVCYWEDNSEEYAAWLVLLPGLLHNVAEAHLQRVSKSNVDLQMSFPCLAEVEVQPSRQRGTHAGPAPEYGCSTLQLY